MRGLTFALFAAVAPAIVNACSHYFACRCGNVDDPQTVNVCNNWPGGKTEVATFDDGHKFCKWTGFAIGINNCDFRAACANGVDSDCWDKVSH